jgi:hypothetical protein
MAARNLPWHGSAESAMPPATRPPGWLSAIPLPWATLVCRYETTSLVYPFGISTTGQLIEQRQHAYVKRITMRFTLGITTKYIDRHPTASMTNNPIVGNQSENPLSIKLRTIDNCIKQSV